MFDNTRQIALLIGVAGAIALAGLLLLPRPSEPIDRFVDVFVVAIIALLLARTYMQQRLG
jgi:hypothetical protein